MKLPTKDELGDKLERFPLLRQMLYEVWFRVVVLCGTAALIALALFLPKIWVRSPEGFLPVVKVSGLDLLQAWSLKRTALKAMAAGKLEDAAYAWQSAFANNPADPGLARGALEAFLQFSEPKQAPGNPIQQALWLLRLTHTNATDLELTVRVFEKVGLYDAVVDLLEPRQENLSPAMEAIYLKALFQRGAFDEFGQRWEEAAGRVASDAELPLYHAAYLAGWGPLATQGDARRTLEVAATGPLPSPLANRLLLRVAFAQSDAALYAAALQRLEERQQDTALDHVGYWRLLYGVGRQDEAVHLSRAYARPPATPDEVVRLAQGYVLLGQLDHAVELLEQSLEKFAFADRVWVTYAQMLAEAKRWEDLRLLALRMRRHEGVRDRLGGFSYYLEGRAELALQRPESAEHAFQQVVGARFENRALGLTTARSLLRLGDAQAARDILLKLESDSEQDFLYWQLLFGAANALKDSDLMLTAITRAYQLRPHDPRVMNNYAATLLIHRARPDEVIKLTLQLHARNPGSAAAKINHAFALLLNKRVADALALLESIAPEKLLPAHATMLYLGLLEGYLEQGRFEEARQAAEHVRIEHLYPKQREWFERTRERLPSPAAA
jgi:tetratricopeptide (TPR) repeat protein